MHYPEKRCSPLFTLHQSDRTPIATTWRRVNHYAARWSVNVSFLESTNYFINTFYTIQNFVEKLKLKLIYITWIIFYVQFYDYKFLNTAKWETEKWIAIFTSIYLFICTSIEKWEFMLFAFCTEILFAKEIIMLPDGHTCALFQHYQSFFLDTYIS